MVADGVVLDSGRRLVRPTAMARMAAEDWREEKYTQALSAFLIAIELSWDGGLHSIAADPHLAKARALFDQDQLHAALDECATAVQVLGAYNDERAASYFCWQIDFRIRNPTPPPTVPPSPQPE